MWMTKVSINHPVFATMVMVGLMVLGLFSYQKLGVEKMPNVEIPALFISVQYPGASPEAIETDLTKPIDEAINTVNGVMRSAMPNFWQFSFQPVLKVNRQWIFQKGFYRMQATT